MKKYKLVKENLLEPIIKPKITPKITPHRPSPIKRTKPSITPKPKATIEDVVKKFLNLINVT